MRGEVTKYAISGRRGVQNNGKSVSVSLPADREQVVINDSSGTGRMIGTG